MIKFKDSDRYVQIVNNIGAIEKMGEWIARSKIFGCNNESQGCVIAIDCFISGLSLIEYAKRNKIVADKPFQQYDAMLAAFHEAGGKSKIISRTPERAAIELAINDDKQVFELSWEDAQKETFPYADKEGDVLNLLAAGKSPRLKAKYATPRSRSVMLFARVISDGIRAMCPEVNYGTYTPEEIEDMSSESETPSTVTVELPKQPLPKLTQPTELLPTKEETPVASDLPGVAGEPVQVMASDGRCLETQREIIKSLMAELKPSIPDIKDRIVSKIKTAGFNGLADLSFDDAEKLIGALNARHLDVWVSTQLMGHAVLNP